MTEDNEDNIFVPMATGLIGPSSSSFLKIN